MTFCDGCIILSTKSSKFSIIIIDIKIKLKIVKTAFFVVLSLDYAIKLCTARAQVFKRQKMHPAE